MVHPMSQQLSGQLCSIHLQCWHVQVIHKITQWSCHTVHKQTHCGGTGGHCCSTMNNTIQLYRKEVRKFIEFRILPSKGTSYYGRGCPVVGQDVPFKLMSIEQPLHAANPQNANVRHIHPHSQTSLQRHPWPRTKRSTRCKAHPLYVTTLNTNLAS